VNIELDDIKQNRASSVRDALFQINKLNKNQNFKTL